MRVTNDNFEDISVYKFAMELLIIHLFLIYGSNDTFPRSTSRKRNKFSLYIPYYFLRSLFLSCFRLSEKGNKHRILFVCSIFRDGHADARSNGIEKENNSTSCVH